MSKKLVFVLMLLAMAAGFIGGVFGNQLVQAKANVQKVVNTQEIRLIDKQGVARASIDLTSKGDLYFALYDAKGKATESMLVTPGIIRASRKTAATVRKLDKMFSGFMPGK
ncbi:MAG: hypothetical protein KQI62_03275 [Deltaproteobacteria bacterium]|nr:hypothetical protein [Deltaproteobacteria bacterium]